MRIKENNNIYPSQLFALVIIASTTFKVVMLPKYLAAQAGRSAFVIVAIMMAIEILMYSLVYYSNTRVKLLKENNKWLVVPVMISIFVVCTIKALVFFGESVSYVASTLFDVGRVAFIVMAFLPVIGYLVYKGGNTIARLTQIVIWVVIAAVGINLLFLRVQPDIGNLFPIAGEGFTPIFEGCDQYFIWFGDYLPLMLLFVNKSPRARKSDKAMFPIVLAIAYIAVVGFFILFTVIYGEAGHYVDFAFSKVAVFTKISQLLGATDFPTVITWLLMAIVKMSLVIYASTMALIYFVKSKLLALGIVLAIIGLVSGFVMATIEEVHKFATSWIRYPIAILQYGLPLYVAIFVRYKHGKASKE